MNTDGSREIRVRYLVESYQTKKHKKFLFKVSLLNVQHKHEGQVGKFICFYTFVERDI